MSLNLNCHQLPLNQNGNPISLFWLLGTQKLQPSNRLIIIPAAAQNETKNYNLSGSPVGVGSGFINFN